jgi:hypothetical protein
MRDRRMKALGLFTALSLAVCLVASGIVSNTGSSYAATSSIQWTRITIPVVGDKQLHPGSDVGPMAVSPDGATVFAAVQDESSLDWSLLKSTDGAFSWQDTGLSDAMAAQVPADTSDIVAVELSPSWNDDDMIFVATKNGVYYSEDRGSTFDDLVPVPGTVYYAPPGTDVITSLDLELAPSGYSEYIVVAVGTADPTAAVGGDVYIFNLGVWAPQGVGAYDVLAVGLSPNYAADEAVIAVVTDASNTVVRTKLVPDFSIPGGAWAGAVFDATSSLNFPSSRACIGFPDDYIADGSTSMKLFVGLSAAGPLGDVFSIQWAGYLVAPTVADLDVRGYANPPTNTIHTETNIWSMAVSGSASSMDILAGAEALNTSALPAPPGQLLVYTSSSGGGNWSPSYDDYLSYKQPTGETKATVVMSSSIAYAGTFGDQSAVSAALSAEGSGGVPFYSWNQRGLIDTSIDEITDMSPSEAYVADGTMFITTRNTSLGDTSLWRTESEGGMWERVYCSTLTGNSTTRVLFDMVRQATNAVILAQSGSKAIIPSDDDSATFQTSRGISLTENIRAFIVTDASTYYAGGANGSVQGTTTAGATWTSSSIGSEIPAVDTVVDLVLADGGDIYAGTDWGGVYKDSGGDLEFIQVGSDTPGVSGDIVHVASNPCDDNFVYAGIQGDAATMGIWRFDLSGDEAEWEQIADGADVGNISSIVCSDCIGMDGVLYAVSASTGTGWRSIDPTTTKEVPVFEEMKYGLGTGDSVRRGLKLVSGSNLLFAVGGASYTQIWTASDEIVNMKLLAPEDGSIFGTIMEDEAFLGRAVVILEWKEIPGAESYEVQIGFDEELDSPVDISYYDGGTPYSEGMVKVAYPWLGTKYYWRVRVGKAGPGGTVGAPYSSQWSDIWSFITPLGPAPSIPELLGPKAGQGNVMLKPALQWNSSVAATGYELILAANCDWSNPALNLSGDSVIGDTAYQLTFNLAKNTSYCWKVRGVNDITHSPWSDTSTFTTGFTAGPENGVLPVWVWVIIVLVTVFILSILVLITQSRRY